MTKRSKINVQGTIISITSKGTEDYICLTDMVDSKASSVRAADVIKNWIRNRSTLEFLGAWESLYNQKFNVVEFDHFKKEAGLPTFTMSVSNWVNKTNAKGVYSVKGRYGGTYAHKDIAFEFGSAISPIFKLHIIKEYQRLKEIETNKYGLEWDVKRILSKTNYRVHTDAIKKYIIPKTKYNLDNHWLEYTDEADMLNIALFGFTAMSWRESNPKRVLKGENIRDIESLNSILIKHGMSKKERFELLSETVQEQRLVLDNIDMVKSLKKWSNTTFVDAKDKSKKQLEEIIRIDKKLKKNRD